MLSISNPLKGDSCGNYYPAGGAESYYTDSAESQGEWFGSAAAKLRLHEKVDPRAFKRLLSGFSPKKKIALVQNAGHRNRQCGWDLTFSAPKSVSVLWALASDSSRKIIEQCHLESVHAALDSLEKTAGITRRGKGGAIKEPASLLFALFRHTTSRALDPQLHIHAVLINLAIRLDGTTGTLQSRDIFRAKMEAGQLYRTELAARLILHLALEIEADKKSFHVRGVSKELCREFSKRRQAIEELLNDLGLDGAVAAKVAALDTRSKKLHIAPEKLFSHWREQARSHGWSTEQAEKLIRACPSKRSYEHEWSSFSHSRKRAKARTEGRHQRRADAYSAHREQKQTFHEGRSTDRDSSQGGKHKQAGQSFFRVEWRTLFRNAPSWSPFKNMRVPIFSILLSDHQKWGFIKWKLDLHLAGFKLGEFRVQDRRLFPHAPRWNPLHKASLPALRFLLPPSFLAQVVQKLNHTQHGFKREH